MKYISHFLILFLFSCGTSKNKESLMYNYGNTQGTTYSIKYISPKGENYQEEIDSLLHQVDLSMSTYKKESIISKINQNKSMETDSIFRLVFNEAMRIAIETKGAFDPTIAPIINYWGFGFENIQNKDQSKLDLLIQTVGYENIKLNETTIVKSNPKTQLDFNAIAQGFTVDYIADHLSERGINNYMVEIGGEVKAKGVNTNGEFWRIGIDKPTVNIEEDRFQAIIQLHNKSVASSGNYRKFKIDEESGIKYAHTIDPNSGVPVQSNLLSVTVMTQSCMQADAYATAFMVMGVDNSIQFLEKHHYLDIDVLMIYSGLNGNWLQYQTKGFKEMTIYSNYK